MDDITFHIDEAEAKRMVIEGLQARFEREVKDAMIRRWHAELDDVRALGDELLTNAAKAAAKGYIASVREYRKHDSMEPTFVLLFDRKEVPLDGA